MKKRAVPFYRQAFDLTEIREITDTIRSGWVTTGRKSREFEKAVASHVGARYAVAVNSCTAAMHLLLVAGGIGKGDEVVTTPYTFAATTEAILYTGAKPVYCDVNYDTLNIDADRAVSLVTKRTAAFLPVHIAGLPARMDEFRQFARRKKVLLFDDAAHALGASLKGKMIGAIGDGSAFSFYATKNLTTGEGGMVVTNRKALAEKVRLLSLHAMSKGAWKRYASGGSWRYRLVDLGYKYNMPDLAASLGLAQIRKFDRMQTQRRRAAERYLANFSGCEHLKLPGQNPEAMHAWHLFLLRLQLPTLKINRDRFISELNRSGIGCSVHFIPLFMHDYYRRRLGVSRKGFPNAYKAYKEVITLPLFPSIKQSEVDYVSEVVLTLCKKHGR
jgi:dTDP-4-amino-4,6-dideoxygalactose transaminase